MKLTKGLLFILLVLLLAGSSCYKKAKLPSADFNYREDHDSIHPDTVTFINLSQNASYYEWTFGDGVSSTDDNPVHIYKDSGQYSILLKSYSNGKEEWAEKSKTIHVK